MSGRVCIVRFAGKTICSFSRERFVVDGGQLSSGDGSFIPYWLGQIERGQNSKMVGKKSVGDGNRSDKSIGIAGDEPVESVTRLVGRFSYMLSERMVGKGQAQTFCIERSWIVEMKVSSPRRMSLPLWRL